MYHGKLVMRDWRRVSDDVFYAEDGITLVDRDTLDFLKAHAFSSSRRRARLCCHPDPSVLLHNMIIVMSGDAYIRPHKHLDKDESFHVIEGNGSLCVFDDDGNPKDFHNFAADDVHDYFFYRIPAGVFHTQLIASDWLVYQETATGPFEPEKSLDASWAPDEDDRSAVDAYINELRQLSE